MKTKKAIGVAIATALFVTFAYRLGYHHGSTSARGGAAAGASLRQIGLAFRQDRNDMAWPFRVIDGVAVPSAQAQER